MRSFCGCPIVNPNELSPCQAHPHPEVSQRLVEERAVNKCFIRLTRGWRRVPAPRRYFLSVFPNACLFCIVYVGRYMQYVPLMCRNLQRPEGGVRSPVAGVIGSCEPPSGAAVWCWEQKSGPWEEYKVLLTTESPPVPAFYLVFCPVIISCFILESKGHIL